MLFSIILPTYNRAYRLGKAIDSVIAQTYTNWELIVVDDGSTDNTKDLVIGYNHPQIVYHYQQNQERSAARNNGINLAKGQYICFLDSDDYLLPNHLDSFYQVLALQGFPIKMLFGYNVVDVEGKTNTEGVTYSPQTFATVEEYLIQHPVRVAAVAVAKEILVDYKFDKTIRIGEDTELWTRIAEKYPIEAINAYTQAYVMHQGQTVNDDNIPMFEGHIATTKLIVNRTPKNRISNQVGKLAITYGYFRLAQVWLKKKNKTSALSAVWKSFFYNINYRFKERLLIILACLGLKKYYS